MRQAIVLVAASAFASGAAAEDVRLCGGAPSQVSPDGRLLNHLPYNVVSRSELTRPSRSLPGRCGAIHRDMVADLEALLTQARGDPEVGSAIFAISCFRARQHQARIFCRPGRSILTRAYQVAPPGYSEHATGLAVDFGDRRGGVCNLEACFARTAVGRWLARNAADFGFEMSFPEGNGQGVAFEPWHWRWVGHGDDGRSLSAQAIFTTARQRFPAVRSAPAAPAAGTLSRAGQ
jgi:D-alanyl-D-alanine carboxypeptidase